MSPPPLSEQHEVLFLQLPNRVPPPPPCTNNRGEPRAALTALRGHVRRSRSLICLDSTYVVDGVLGWARRHHKWQTSSGPARHVDLWTQMLNILDEIGPEIQWLHVPSHIGIRGNEKADFLANEGRQWSLLLRGHISAGPTVLEEDDPPPPREEVLYQEPPELEFGTPPPPANHKPRCARTAQWKAQQQAAVDQFAVLEYTKGGQMVTHPCAPLQVPILILILGRTPMTMVHF